MAGIKSRETCLEDVVVRSRAHRIRGRLFTDRTGDDDERQVAPRQMDELERPERAEFGHRPVADHDVPVSAGQHLTHGRCLFDAHVLDRTVERTQRTQNELFVGGRVLDEQHPKWSGHGAPPGTGGASFRRSQNRPSVRAACANSANSTGLRT